MNRIVFSCAIAAATIGATWSPASQAAAVRCDSANGRYQTCAVDTRGGVRLTRQLSSQGCWQNDTWGYDSNRIWVTNGCRAEFQVGDYQPSNSGSNNGAIAGVAVAALIGAALLANKNKDRDRYDSGYNDGYYGPGYGGGYNPQSTFRCESTNGRQVYCQIPFRGHVEVSRQISKARCQYGVTWGVDGMRVWVNNGCRADFAVY